MLDAFAESPVRFVPLLLPLAGCPGFGSGGPPGGLEEAVEHPTYVDDVKPILDANCIQCHTSPPNEGAPSTFRLDVYETEGDVLGAGDKADRIAARTESGTMPKGGPPLPQAEVDTLAAWSDDGAPYDADTGGTDD